MSENNETVKLKQTSVAMVIFLSIITGGIYFAIWYLNRIDAFNKLHSSEKLGKGIPILGVICFAIVLAMSLYSGFSDGISQVQSVSELQLPINYIDLVANIIELIILIPFIHLTFKMKKILQDHYNGYMNRNEKFSTFLTLILLFIYLQYKINKLEKTP